MWKLRPIIPSWTLSKIPLMVWSHGKSVTFLDFSLVQEPFLPISLHSLFFGQIHAVVPALALLSPSDSSILSTCLEELHKQSVPLGKLPVPGEISQSWKWVIHHDKNALWRQSEVWSLGDLPEKLGNWLHMRLVNHCHQLVCWVYKRRVVWWLGVVWKGCAVLQSSWKDAVTRSEWLNGYCWSNPRNTV